MVEKNLAEHLAGIEHPQAVRISPDGKQIVYGLGSFAKKGEHDVSSIWLAEYHVKHSARQLTSGLYADSLPQWSPDGKSVAFLSDRADQGKSSAIYVLPLTGGEAYPITAPKNEKNISSYAWSPDGKYIAYLSPDEKTAEQKKKEEDKTDAKVYGEDWEFARLRCVHVATKEVSVLFEKDAHVTRLAWNPDESKAQLAFVTQRTPELDADFESGVEIELVSLTGQARHFRHFPNSISDFVFGGNALAWESGRESNPCSSHGIYTASLDSDEALQGLDHGQDDSVLGLTAFGDDLFMNLGCGLTDKIIEVKTGTVLYESECQIASWDAALFEGRPTIALVKGNASNPAEVFSYNGTEMVQLSRHGLSLPKNDFGTAQAYKCTADDGSEIDGILVLPDSPSAVKPYPTLVLIHGGPYTRVNIAFGMPFFPLYNWTPYLVAAGYAVLCPNYRGGSSRGEKHAAAARGGMGTLDYDDVVSLTKQGIADGIIDETRVGIGGWSQGGFLSYLAVTRPEKFRFKAAVCGAGVTDWDALSLTSDLPYLESSLAGRAPWETNSTDTRARHGSALWHMKGVDENMRTPVLILHGEEDVRIPISQARSFHRGCKSLGWECTLVTYPREGHLISERAHVVDMLERMRRFYDAHLR